MLIIIIIDCIHRIAKNESEINESKRRSVDSIGGHLNIRMCGCGQHVIQPIMLVKKYKITILTIYYIIVCFLLLLIYTVSDVIRCVYFHSIRRFSNN